MKPKEKLLPTYRRQLRKYEEQGEAEKADIEKRLIKRIEARK